MGSSSTQSDFAAGPTGKRDESRCGLVNKSAAPSALPADPPAVPFSISKARTIAQRRHETLRRFNRLRKTRSAAKAARMVGASIPTLWRWQKKFTGRGLAGLRPRHFKAGRRSPFEKIRLTPKAVRELESLLVQQSSPRAAWQRFANISPACPPSVASYVQRHGKAPALLANLARIIPVQARVFASIDGRRIFLKLPARGILTAKLAAPPEFKLMRLKT